jgi:TonB family protein
MKLPGTMKLPAGISVVAHALFILFFAIGARFDQRVFMGGFGPGDFTPVSLVSAEELPGAVPVAAPAVSEPRPEPAVPVPAAATPITRAREKPERQAPDLAPQEDPGIKLPDTPKPRPTPDSTVAKAPPPPPKAAPPPPSPAQAALAGVPVADAGSGGAVAAGIVGGGGGGGGFGDFAYYRIAIQNKIAANWSPGFVSGEAKAIVYFRIIRSGRVVGAKVEESSGIPFYDQTALRAVLEASPLPPLPEQFPDDTVGVHFLFRYKP